MTPPTDHPQWTRTDEIPTTLAGILPTRWIGQASHWLRLHPVEGTRGFYVTAWTEEGLQRPFYFSTHEALLWLGTGDLSVAAFLEDIESEIGGLLDTICSAQIESVGDWLRKGQRAPSGVI